MEQMVRDVFGETFLDLKGVGSARPSPSPARKSAVSPSRKTGRSISPGANSFDLRDRAVLDALDARIAAQLEAAGNKGRSDIDPPEKSGKLGPQKVHFDVATHVGSFIIGTDRVGVGSQSHFSSIKANVCVFKGKWQYEVLLGSKGVMQVGWCTRDCQFSEENGVGDTSDSYSYDGNRVRKWNVSTYRYGEPWLSGDIIGVTFDCDAHEIEFFRNGRSLGVAFDDVKSAPGLAYFPGVSLGDGENLVANFGATPFKHPALGFRPLQDPPESDVLKAKELMAWLDKLLEVHEAPAPKTDAKGSTWKEIPSCRTIVFLVGSKIFRHLSHLLVMPYVVESVFMPFLHQSNRINVCLTLMWALMEEHELTRCLEYVCISLLTRFRQSASGGEFPNQKLALQLLRELLSHHRTRKLLLKNVFFERIRFPTFMHLKPLDDEALKVALPVVHWEGKPEADRLAYENAISKLKSDVAELEALQLQVLRLLLTKTDGTGEEPSSRSLFMVKIRRFIRENVWSARIPVVMQTPTPVMLCFFHRLLTAYLALMEEESKLDEGVHVPLKAFCDDTLKYFDCNRLGGAYPYLKRTFRKELAEFLGVDYVPPTPSRNTEFGSLGIVALAGAPGGPNPGPGGQLEPDVVLTFDEETAAESALSDTSDSDDEVRMNIGLRRAFRNRAVSTTLQDAVRDPPLHELIDSIIWIFHLGAHKQLAKMTALRENLDEFLNSEKELRKKMKESTTSSDVFSEMEASSLILEEKIADEVRHMAWVRAVIYTKERQKDLLFLTRVMMETLNRASEAGPLLAFVPDFYIDSLCECVQAIRVHLHPTVHFDDDKFHGKSLLTALGSLIARHFADHRVVFADSKDTLIEALATFVSSEKTLRAMENMKKEESEMLVQMLLRPYESRPWAQTNWILVRLWKGNGYGFRYSETPNQQQQFYPKMAGEGVSHTNHIKPCPSPFYQSLVATTLMDDPEMCKVFLNSVLNQLNWAFSEFIGMMQEIQNAFSRPDRVFIESRQLKMCSTCFDLTLALLRVIEMCVVRCPAVFTAPDRTSADLLLSRLCQVLCQILNRVSTSVGSFNQVISLSIPSMEAVSHYPIMSAVAGIVLGLLEPEIVARRRTGGDDNLVQPATRALLTDPSFQLSSLAAMLGRTPPQLTPTSKDSPRTKARPDKVFSFKDYCPEVMSDAEIKRLEDALSYLEDEERRLEATMTPTSKRLSQDEDVCPICYAYKVNSAFVPCKHRACRKCVAQHLMNRRECFFCKASVTAVVDENGKEIPDLKPPPHLGSSPLDRSSPARGPSSMSGPQNRPGAGADFDVEDVVSYTLPFRNRNQS